MLSTRTCAKPAKPNEAWSELTALLLFQRRRGEGREDEIGQHHRRLNDALVLGLLSGHSLLYFFLFFATSMARRRSLATPHHSNDHARSSAAVPHGSSKAVLLRLEKLSSLLAFRSPLCSQAQTGLAGLCPADGGASEGSGGGVWAEEQSARSRQA